MPTWHYLACPVCHHYRELFCHDHGEPVKVEAVEVVPADQLRGAVQERDEAVALLHKAAHRLVPIPPYQEIADWLTRYEGGQ